MASSCGERFKSEDTSIRASVARFVAQLRRERPGTATRSGIAHGQGPPARRVAFLAVQRPERLDEEETAYLTHLRAHDETIETACGLSQSFAQMVRDRQGLQRDAWIDEARASGIGELERFAAGLLTDEAAVRQG